jgi:hypothetical protein
MGMSPLKSKVMAFKGGGGVPIRSKIVIDNIKLE